jgi:hypothetical protein
LNEGNIYKVRIKFTKVILDNMKVQINIKYKFILDTDICVKRVEIKTLFKYDKLIQNPGICHL